MSDNWYILGLELNNEDIIRFAYLVNDIQKRIKQWAQSIHTINEEFTATSENTIKTKEMPILIEVYIPLSCTVTNM